MWHSSQKFDFSIGSECGPLKMRTLGTVANNRERTAASDLICDGHKCVN